MLNFYYDPILGLKYDFLGEMFLVDLKCVPTKEFDAKKWLEILKEARVYIMESQEDLELVTTTLIADYKL
jgi:hypothetical protein